MTLWNFLVWTELIRWALWVALRKSTTLEVRVGGGRSGPTGSAAVSRNRAELEGNCTRSILIWTVGLRES